MKDALRSLWRDLSELRAKTGQKHLAVLKKLAGEEQWPWAIEQARTLMRGKSLRWRPRRRCDTLSGANYRKPWLLYYRRPYMAWFAAVLVGLVDFLMIREDCAVKLVLNLLHAVQDRSRSAHCSITKEL